MPESTELTATVDVSEAVPELSASGLLHPTKTKQRITATANTFFINILL